MRQFLDRRTVLKGADDMVARASRSTVHLTKDLALELQASFLGLKSWDVLSGLLPLQLDRCSEVKASDATAPVTGSPAAPSTGGAEIEFRFRKGHDTQENRDQIALYLASILEPDLLFAPRLVSSDERSRTFQGNQGWVHEDTRVGKYQLGRNNDFFMRSLGDRWVAGHRYMNTELISAARTLLFNRFATYVEPVPSSVPDGI